MYLVRQVLDKEIDDTDGLKSGKVNDLLLELPDDGPPCVVAILTGPTSFSSLLPGWMGRLTAWIRTSLLRLDPAEPDQIDWWHVTRIDVAVHIDLDREKAGLLQTQEDVWKRWLKPLPFSER